MVKNYLQSLLLFSFVFIIGCASQATKDPHSRQLSEEWDSVVNTENPNVFSLRALATKATALGEWQIVWQSRLLQCQVEQLPENKRAACQQAQLAANIFPLNNAMQFDTNLIFFQQFNELDYLKLTENYAKTTLQKVKLSLAKEQIPPSNLLALIDNNSLEYAQLLYLQGKTNNDVSKLLQANRIFRKKSQAHKVADTLFLLAMIHQEKNQTQAAVKYISECLLILENLDSTTAYDYAKEWYDVRLLVR